MSGPADWHEHGPAELDESTSDALIDGRVSPAEVPAGYEEVAQLIGVIRRDRESEESFGGFPTVGAMVEQINRRRSIVSLHPPGRRRGRKRGAAAAVVVGVLVSAGTAAAATGALPSAIQATVHDVATDLGISIPGPGRSATSHIADPAQACRQSAQTGNAVPPMHVAPILGPCGVPTGGSIGQGAAPSTGGRLPDASQPTRDRRQAAATNREPTSAVQTSTALSFDPATDFSALPSSVAPAAGGLLSGSGSGSPASTPGGRGGGQNSGNSGNPPTTARSGGPRAGATASHRGTGSRGPSGGQVGSTRTGHSTTGRHAAPPRSARRPPPRSQTRPSGSTATGTHLRDPSPSPSRPHGHEG
jgi:hypothetical protein